MEEFNYVPVYLEGKIYLPKFVIQETGGWRDINYEMDILSRIDWNKVSLESLKDISLSELKAQEQEVTVGLSEDEKEVITLKENVSKEGGLELNKVFLTRQILDIVPNPWVAFQIGKKVIDIFSAKYDDRTVLNNLVFIIEKLRNLLQNEKDKLGELVFRDLIEKKILWFFLFSEKGGFKLPSNIKIKKSSKSLIRDDNTPIQRSLFEFVPEEWFNETEKSVAVYLDEQKKLLWWYRNMSRQDYNIQGWKKYKIYPDFIFSDLDDKKIDEYKKVYVVEIKGLYLKNEDTDYKKSVFDFCNKLGELKEWEKLRWEFNSNKIEFQIIFEDEWKERINKIFSFS